jgi:hypothetical protein
MTIEENLKEVSAGVPDASMEDLLYALGWMHLLNEKSDDYPEQIAKDIDELLTKIQRELTKRGVPPEVQEITKHQAEIGKFAQ